MASPATEWVPVTFAGVVASHYCRNGQQAHGPFAKALARAINHIHAMRRVIIPGWTVRPGEDTDNIVGFATIYRTRFRSGFARSRLVVEVHVAPPWHGAVGQTCSWKVQIGGSDAADVNTGVTEHNYGGSAAYATNMSVVSVMRAEYALTSRSDIDFAIMSRGGARIVGCYLYEKPRTVLVDGTDARLQNGRLKTRGQITDNELDDATGMAFYAYEIAKNHRAHHINWSANDGATGGSVTIAAGTSYTNLFDGSTGARSSTTAGIPCPAQFRGTYMNNVAGTNTVKTMAYAYGSRTAGSGNVIIRLTGDAGSADININGAAGWYSTSSFTLSTASAYDKVDIAYLTSDGTTAGTLENVVLYQHAV